MTEQYQQTNMNQPMSGARYVDQRDVDSSLLPFPPAVVLNADDEFVIASDDDGTPYQINLPDVREVPGKDIVIASRLVPASAVAVNIATLSGSGQTINGLPAVALALAGDTIVLRADPPDNLVDPVTQATNWTIVRGPSAP